MHDYVLDNLFSDSDFQLEELMMQFKDLDLPKPKDDETIFEYVINDCGKWEHWTERVNSRFLPVLFRSFWNFRGFWNFSKISKTFTGTIDRLSV